MNKNSISKISESDWETLENMEDEEIDLTEIPEVTAEQMARAKLRIGGKPIPKGKIRVNMYHDSEIVEYFKAKAGGRGYQTLINETLKESMLHRNLEQLLRQVIREELNLKK